MKGTDETPAIKADGVTKSIKKKKILDGVSIYVPKGSIYVLAGPNGAGKTTTIRILVGLISRDSGKVEVLGVEPQSPEWDKVKSKIGYLPEDASPYERLSGWENLLFTALLYADGDRSKALNYVNKAIEISGLSRSDLSRRTSSYSKGMKRRLLLGQVLMHEPELVIMDEPTSGLDVFTAYRVKRLIKELARKGTTFLITTHDMKEAEELASRVGFIHEGRIVFEGEPGEALDMYNAETLEEAFVRAFSRDYRW
ncbi:MAG: ABC transporter ATP-binding protein [Desulfurococcales archaeon]|nr:ABC transporter ATP-binding protein [Desulfurococcales archaeon]